MAHIPKLGRTPGEYVVESSQAGKAGWRSLAASMDQREAVELLEAGGPCSYTTRVVLVVAVRPPGSAGSQELAEYGPDRYAGEDFARPRGVTP